MFLSLRASRSIRKWRGTEGFQGFTVDRMDQYNIQQMKPKTLPSDYAGLGRQTYETEMCIQRKNWSICWYTKWLLHFAAIGMAPGFRFLCLYKLVVALSLLWVEQSIFWEITQYRQVGLLFLLLFFSWERRLLFNWFTFQRNKEDYINESISGSGQGSVKEKTKCGCVLVGVEYCGPYKTWPFWKVDSMRVAVVRPSFWTMFYV